MEEIVNGKFLNYDANPSVTSRAECIGNDDWSTSESNFFQEKIRA